MAGINKVILVGNLGDDPDVRETGSGIVCNISVATSESWKDRDGNRQERTEWHRVVAFGKLAEIMDEYLRKGAKVYIEGKIRTEKWTDKDGVDRYTTKVYADNMQMLDSRRDGGERDARGSRDRDDHGGGRGGRDRDDGGERQQRGGGRNSEASSVRGGGTRRAPAPRREPAQGKPANFDDVPLDDDPIPF